MARLAFLGTGLMGSALAEAAVGRGDDVTAWNRTPDKARALARVGVRSADTPAEAVRDAERVHVILKDDASVDAVLAACGDALKGKVIVDHTTTAPAGTAARARALAERGLDYLHAPVFMSPAMCRAGQGIMLAAGPRALFDRLAPALSAMTGKLEYFGERPDLAAAQKLFGNAMIIAICAGLADVYAMAKSLEIPLADAHALFSIFNPAGVLAYRGAAMAKGDFTPSFEMTMARKDVRLMEETAGAEPLAVLPAIGARMDQLIARGLGAEDLGALAADTVKGGR